MKTIVKFKEPTHWKTLSGWWDERNFPCPPLEFLPRRGAVVMIDDKPVCAGFITFTDAGCAVIGHLVSDPKVEGQIRHAALDDLIQYLIETARMFGFKAVFASASQNLPKLKERFEKLGFQQTDSNINCFGRILCPMDS